MNRLGYIAQHPKRTLGALGTLLAAAGLTVGSGAYFEDTASSNSNIAKAGELAIEVYGSTQNKTTAFDASGSIESVNTATDAPNQGGLTFNISKLVPTKADGTQAVTRAFQVKNTGDVPAYLRLDVLNTIANAGDTLHEQAKITVTRTGGRVVLPESTFAAADNGRTVNPIADRNAADTERLPLQPGATYDYTVKVFLPETNVDQSALMNDAVATELKVIARTVNGTDS